MKIDINFWLISLFVAVALILGWGCYIRGLSGLSCAGYIQVPVYVSRAHI